MSRCGLDILRRGVLGSESSREIDAGLTSECSTPCGKMGSWYIRDDGLWMVVFSFHSLDLLLILNLFVESFCHDRWVLWFVQLVLSLIACFLESLMLMDAWILTAFLCLSGTYLL
jgi:hypothetical protein